MSELDITVCANLPEGGLDFQTMKWLAEQMPGGFFIYGAREPMELIYANSGVLRIFGCDTTEEFRELTGNTFRGLVHPEDFAAVQESIDRQIADSANASLDYVEYRIIRKDGSVRWVDDYGRRACFPDIGDAYYVFIGDITERRRAKEEKERIEAELDRQKRASELKSDFLFNISHDIRTPMNAIMGFSELAQRHLDQPEQLRDDLEKVLRSGNQMMSLIDDLLEMSSLEQGHVVLHPESSDLREQLSLAVDLFRPRLAEKGLTLTEAVELPEGNVLLDVGRFHRILNNLLSNALKFTPAGGTVTVSARRTELSEPGYGRYAFQVADTGVGMTEEYMRRMFAAFEREESSTKAGVTGAGLGLSITKQLVDLMGGSISVQSKKGEGSVFTVYLPLKQADETAAPFGESEADGKPKAKGQYRILLAEDIEINRMLAEAVLAEAGFLPESVPDGCDAVDAIAQHPERYYDLVLMDIQMPVMNGYEATRAIRALGREDSRTIPILALSANARDEDRRQSIESGMDDHIAKPFDAAKLIEAINSHIAAREQEK